MERELMMTGIGGQGVQLAARVLAGAAVAEGREVMLFGSYGGMMRGGNTDTTLVVGDGPIESPPTISTTWSAIVMHEDYWQPLHARLRDGSVLLLNSSVFAAEFDHAPFLVIDIPATDIAVDVGSIMTATMAMVGAYCAVTAMVRLPSLVDALAAALPSYRSQHIALNAAALEAGFRHAPSGAAPAWTTAPAGLPS